MEKILRAFLFFLGFYLVVDGLIHLLNIRLFSVANVWPHSAYSYAVLLNTIYASFVFLAASLVLVAQKDLRKYRTLVLVSGIWAFLHGILLGYLSLTQDFMGNFAPFPSLYVWIPFYNQYLFFEAFLAFIYAILTITWYKKLK